MVHFSIPLFFLTMFYKDKKKKKAKIKLQKVWKKTLKF